MSLYNNFNHATPVKVRFRDLDALNHVNNAVYLNYLEEARMSYFEDLFGIAVEHSDLSMILANVKIDFLRPVLMKDKVAVYTRCSRLGSKSFDLEYAIVKDENGTLTEMASASTVLVAFDYTQNKTVALLDEWKETINEFENN